MMKMMILAPRRAGMTHAEFRAYVTQVHGPLVKRITEVAADIRHYHYNFPVPGAADRAFGHPLADLDIVTQGYFDSREAQLRNMQHPRFMQFLRPDEANFADTERALMHYTDEHPIVAGETTATKLFCFRRRAPSLSREAFQAMWKSGFPPLLDHTPLRRQLARYVQNHVQAEAHHPHGTQPRYYDVIDEFWLRDVAALESLDAADAPDAPEAPASIDARAPLAATDPIRRFEAEVLDTGRTRSFVATMVANIP